LRDGDWAEVRVEPADPHPVERWFAAFQPLVSLERADGALVLRSSRMTAAQIEDALLCARVTERLRTDRDERRRLVMAELLT